MTVITWKAHIDNAKFCLHAFVRCLTSKHSQQVHDDSKSSSNEHGGSFYFEVSSPYAFYGEVDKDSSNKPDELYREQHSQDFWNRIWNFVQNFARIFQIFKEVRKKNANIIKIYNDSVLVMS